MKTPHLLTATVVAIQAQIINATRVPACPAPSGDGAPVLAPGYELQIVATGLAAPRGIAFDARGHLLVVENDKDSITAYTIAETNGCVELTDPVTVVGPGNELNYGIQVNETRLYASSADKVFTWEYDIQARTASGQETLVTGMNTSGQAVRPLQLSRFAPNNLLVSRPATPDFDPGSTSISGGTGQVRAYNLTGQKRTYDWKDGALVAWGVRNPISLAEHPGTGDVWSLDPGSDNITRDGVDVSAHNPADELNSLGPIVSPGAAYFGYPFCHAVWDVDALPNNDGLAVGDQFASDPVPELGNQERTDQDCQATTGPRLVFEAHSTPVDIKFNSSGNDLWVAFYGPWTGKGGKVSIVEFENGVPVEPVNSTSAARDILSQGVQRFLSTAFDVSGRLFLSTFEGDILMISHIEG